MMSHIFLYLTTSLLVIELIKYGVIHQTAPNRVQVWQALSIAQVDGRIDALDACMHV